MMRLALRVLATATALVIVLFVSRQLQASDYGRGGFPGFQIKAKPPTNASVFNQDSLTHADPGDALPVPQTDSVKPGDEHLAAPTPISPTESPAPDKVIVMAKIEAEDTSWVEEHLSDWGRAIYTVDNVAAELHTPANKGRESMAYLTYVIENYYHLPEMAVFLHSHRDGYPVAWHTDALNYDNVESVRSLRLDHVQRTGYVNLRCIWIPGCPEEIQPFRDPPEDWRPHEGLADAAFQYMFNTTAPATIAQPCCSQFAVSRRQILERPIDDYVRYRQWIFETEVDDYTSGRVMEYFWHIIFGKEAVL